MIDLSNWKFTGGDAKEVKPIPPDYESKWFKKIGENIQFSVKATDKTTKGSHYPRAELRELIKGKEAAWKVKNNGLLKAILAVNELPITEKGTSGRIVIGQIHGPDDELCRLYYDNGKVYFYDDKAGSKKKETKFDLKTHIIPLNQPFAYSIEVKDNKLIVIVAHDGKTYKVDHAIGSFWKDKALYYKTGVYCQVGKAGSEAGTVGTGTASATFYKIEVSHG